MESFNILQNLEISPSKWENEKERKKGKKGTGHLV